MSYANDTITFYGKTITTVKHDDVPMVVMKHVATNIGIDIAGQVRKLRAQGWANIQKIVTTCRKNQTQSVLVIDLPSLQRWLDTITVDRLTAEKRELLETYRLELVPVLEAYWGVIQAKPTNTVAAADFDAQIQQAQKLLDVLHSARAVIWDSDLSGYTRHVLDHLMRNTIGEVRNAA